MNIKQSSLDNLKKGTPLNKRSKEEQRKIQSMGGLASKQKRKEIKLFKEAIAERMGEEDFNKIVDKVIANALKNGGKDFEILRDTLGQKPVEIQQVIETPTISDDLNE